MTKDIQDAVRILGRLERELREFDDPCYVEHWFALQTLNHAIRHLAYPDRDVYPKVRHARKTNPWLAR